MALANRVEIKGVFGCNLEASDSVRNEVDLELQSDSLTAQKTR
jgi:hypothetical protein